MNICNNQIAEKCNAWINKEETFYHKSIRKVKKYGELAGLLHIYRLGSDYTQCKNVFRGVTDYEKFVKYYHNCIHSTFGVRTLLAWSWKSNEDIKLFCASWLIHGDLYKALIYQIMTCFSNPLYKNMEQELNGFKNCLIYESVYLGIKSTEDWMKYDKEMRDIKGWVILSDDLKNILSSYIKKAEPISKSLLQSKGSNVYNNSSVLFINKKIKLLDKRENLPTNKSMSKQKKNTSHKIKTDENTFFNMLKCDDSIKKEVIRTLADETLSGNTTYRMANIRLALERNEWIDIEIKFAPFYKAFILAIKPFITQKDFKFQHQNKVSSIYYKNKILNISEKTEKLSTAQELCLYETKRICKILNGIKGDAEKPM